MRWNLDPAMRAAARDWWDQPHPRPVVAARPAATVMLVRDGTDGLQVFMQQRVEGMAFAPGAVVFPGGGRDPGDESIEHTAIRELFEECGVLLAGDPDGGLPDTDTPEWEERRVALERHETSLSEVIAQSGLRVRPELLRPWARWLTPEYAPRRFDTWFFLVVAPEALPRHIAGESLVSRWVRPGDLLTSTTARLMPPTRVVLHELSAISTVADLPAGRELTPLLLRLVEQDGDLQLDGPDLQLDGPELQLDGPDLQLDGPDLQLDGPDLQLDGPDLQLDGPDR